MGYTNKDRAYKSFIVSFFYDVRNFKGSVSSLAGPQLKRVVDIIDKLNPNYINIYENCPATFDKQLKDKKKYFDSKENLLLNFESLEESEIVEFIDADLMKTYRSDGLIIKSLLSSII